MFIDLHSHILPGIDDGADSVMESLSMAKVASESGTNIIVATPHFNNPEKTHGKIDFSVISDSFASLTDELKNADISVRLFQGAEILARSNLEEFCESKSVVTINGSRYVLVEFYFDESIDNVHHYTDILIDYGYIPVIAHPERYSFFYGDDADREDIYSLLEKGCRFQLNTNSILGNNGKPSEDFAMWMLESGCAHIIASDCHNVLTRSGDLSDVYIRLLDLFPEKKLQEWLHDNPKRILLDLDI